MLTLKKISPCPRSSWTWAFFRAPRPRRLLLLAALFGVCLGAACHRRDPAELPLSVQVAEVDNGLRESILVEKVALGDIDLESLAFVRSLKELLSDNPDSVFSAAGIASLASLPNLRHLRLRGHGIDDAALAEIAKIKSLRILNVPQSEMTDAGLTSLSELPFLEQLRIGSPHISAAGIAALAALPTLKRLHTIDLPVGDDELLVLGRMPPLESLYIDGGTFSDAAVEELFRARPELHVHFNQEHHDRDPHRHSHH